MSRAHVIALTLVNWKGVFYERYRLDRHVTALEGANGAGKTTVMIAAYVVLLPDMSRLRFTNLGESGATGGDRGIWGRLGEPGRPAYAALDLQLPNGRRAIAGVMLRRQSEPSVEPTAFMIDELDPETPLSELFLLRNEASDQVAELDEIKAAVRSKGARIEVFRTIKDYFAALFERGVTPLRLGSDEERNKLNEMLRTSMTGGISRVLTTELRGFLLKEETGLGDVLARMRANLDACRRTRNEVAEARVVERDVSGVYEAGQAMFSSAWHAARLAAEEAVQRAGVARQAHTGALQHSRELEQQATQLAASATELESQLTAANQERDQCASDLERGQRAAQLAERLAALEVDLQVLESRAACASRDQIAANAERDARCAQREQLQVAYHAAALGLANLQAGLDELHRRAHAQRQFARSLVEARAALATPELSAEQASNVLAELLEQRPKLLAERAQRERERDGAQAQRSDRELAEAALARLEASALVGDSAEASDHSPLTRARRVLSQLAEREAEFAQLPMLRERLAELLPREQRQHDLRARAQALRLDTEPFDVRAFDQHREHCERELNAALARRDSAASQLTAAHAALQSSRDRRVTGEGDVQRFRALEAAAERASLALGETLANADDLQRASETLVTLSAELLARKTHLSEDRETCLRRAAELDGPAAALDPELLRLRDELGAELVLNQFDHVPQDEAAELEARLGALAQGLLVDDPAAAAELLRDKPRTLDTLWLVRAGAALDRPGHPAELVASGSDVVVDEPLGVRITRRPAQPTLGAKARAARAADLRARAESIGADLEAIASRMRQLSATRRDLDQLTASRAMWAAGDPSTSLDALAHELAARQAALDAAAAASATARAECDAWQSEHEALSQLHSERGLLEAPNLASRVSALERRIEQADALQHELSQVVRERTTLRELLEVLRHPHHADAPEQSQARMLEIDAELERAYRACTALEDVLAHRHAAHWQDAAATLASSAALVPSLEAQHDQARAALNAADQAVRQGDAAWDATTRAAQAAAVQHDAARVQHEHLRVELQALGGAPDAASMAQAEQALARARERLVTCERAVRSAVADAARLREQARQAQARAHATDLEAREHEHAATPLTTAFEAWKTRCESLGLIPDDLAADSGSVALAARAESSRSLLFDRLARSRGSEDTLRELQALNSDAAELSIWLQAREWLRRRVPAQIASDSDPLLALERLRDHLDVLEGRLERQESDLRGASEDVARGIDVQVRRARGQVRRLNAQLAGIRFGSIAAIRVDMRRIERMEQILRALREGEAQELLFLPSLPIDEALEEIFRRYGGGRGGGQRLLDYREYVELAVEIQRQSSEQWEPASPTRLSTGEAIGVGASLMMVVLTEWERDSNLLRAQEQRGSLRFLFLDEANRLSRDNLGVLFELCKQLDLQLLIAAPEVARSEGNTTYRLVRHIAEDGREEVIVSGRRAVAVPMIEAE